MEPSDRRVLRATKCYWGLSFLSLDSLLSEVGSLLQVRKRARLFWRWPMSTILLTQHESGDCARQVVLIAFPTVASQG